MRPSDSLDSVGRRSGSPRFGLPEAGSSSLPNCPYARGRISSSEVFGPGLLCFFVPAWLRGEPRVSQVSGPSSSCVPRSVTPPPAPSPGPNSQRRCCRLQAYSRLGQTAFESFEANLPRPTCLRAYASPGGHPRVSQGSLPAAGLGFGRTGFAPAGRQTEFWGLSHLPSSQTRSAWSHE